MVVHEQTLPYRGVEAWGSATLSPDGFHDAVRRTAARYYGEDAADAFADAVTEPGLVVRLVPDHIRAGISATRHRRPSRAEFARVGTARMRTDSYQVRRATVGTPEFPRAEREIS